MKRFATLLLALLLAAPLLAAPFLIKPVFAQTPPAAALSPAPSSTFDGQWKGTSDAGTCAPLEIALSIEYGFVDGTAIDTGARGPVPNPSKSAPPPATPGLWQLHGNAGNGASFSVMAVASVRVAADRAAGKITVRRDGAGLVLSEDGGCRRTARLARG